jgi:hypothetical protein
LQTSLSKVARKINIVNLDEVLANHTLFELHRLELDAADNPSAGAGFLPYSISRTSQATTSPVSNSSKRLPAGLSAINLSIALNQISVLFWIGRICLTREMRIIPRWLIGIFSNSNPE